MKKVILALLTVTIVASFMGCQKSVNTQDNTNNAASESTQTKDDVQSTEKTMTIETKYGNFVYPAEWEKELITEESEENGIYYLLFSTKAFDDVIQLFKVMVCSEEGDSVGSVKGSDGIERNVFIDISDLGDVTKYDEDTQNRLFAMQEAVNILTEGLQ